MESPPRYSKRRALDFLILVSVFSLFILPRSVLTESPRIRIVTTVFPLMEFTKAVCGERGEVSLLLPPGAEVHTWNPRPSDIVRISSADLFVYVGANLEPWIHDLLRSIKNSALRVLEASKDLPLIETDAGSHQNNHARGEFDPHIWLDFELDQIIIDRIASLLSEVDPRHSSLFLSNAASYKEKLKRLHLTFQNGLNQCAQRTIILGGHAAFSYLARKYNLQQISLYGLSPDSKPTPKQMVEVVKLAKRHHVRAIFFEEYVSDKLAKVIAKEIGAQTLVLNPGANLRREQLTFGMSFFDIMEKNLENLRDGLNCR